MKELLKRSLLFLMVMSLLFSTTISANTTNNAVFSMTNQSVTIGENVEITLSIESSVEVNGILLDTLEYDENILEFVEFAEYGELITSNIVGDSGVDSGKGEISLGYANTIVPNGQICKLLFKTKAAGTSNVSMSGLLAKGGQPVANVVSPSCTVTVSQKQITGVTLADKTVTYDGNEHTLEPTGLTEGMVVKSTTYNLVTEGYFASNELPTYAGEYDVEVVVGADGYQDLKLNAKLYIKERKVTMTVKDVRFSTCGNGANLPMPEITSDYAAFTKEVEEHQIIVDFSSVEADNAMVDGKYLPGTYTLNAEISEADIAYRYDVTIIPGKLIITNNHAITYTPAKAPTCTEAGNIASYYCSGCRTYFEDAACTKEITTDVVIPALGHTMTEHAAKDATCTEDGNVAYYSCSVCKGNFQDEEGKTPLANVVIRKAHDLEKVEAKDATCTEDGNVAYYKCNGTCGKNYTDINATRVVENVVVPAGHKLTYVREVKKTCTTDGNVAYYKCSGTCGKNYKDDKATEVVENVVIPASHELEKVEAKDATCTTDGNVAHYNCSVCKGNFQDEEGKTPLANVVIGKAHDLEKVEAVAKTCTEDGNVEYYKCNGACGKNYTDINASAVIENVVIPASHELEKVEAKAKTCTTDGNVEYYKCNGTCGKNYTDDKATEVVEDVVIPASHELEKVEAVAKTCTTDGNVEYYKCNGTCGKNYTDDKATDVIENVVIPAEHGDIVEIPAIDATCENVGLTAGKKCTICGVATVKPEVVAKTSHTEEIIAGKSATCTETGLTEGKKCSVCETVTIEQEEIPALGHNWTEWDTTTDPTKKTRECQNDGCGEKEEYIIDTECEHTEVFTRTKTAATCDAAGVNEVYCNACGELVGEEEVAKLEHNLEDVAENAATCVAEGNIAHKHCTLCGKNFVNDEVVENVVVPVAEHAWGAADINGVETCANCTATKKVAINTTAPEASITVEKLDEVLDETDEALINAGATVVPQISVDEIAENDMSDEIKTEMDSTKTGFASYAVEINISKKITLLGGTFDYEIDVPETSSLVKVDITLPTALRNKINYYVARVHNGISEKITTTANGNGEYIVIDKINHIISMFVKNFSEYAVVADNYVAPAPSLGGGSVVSNYTVKFETNGGSTVKDITVKKNAVVNEPTAPTKDGFKFDGWYTDKNLTTAYDFNAKVTKSFTLYAKWTEIEKEPEVVEPNTKLTFTDVNENDWFYESVMSAYESGLMKGMTETEFAPTLSVTRAMFVTVLHRLAGEPVANFALGFDDVKADEWYTEAIRWAASEKIVLGVTDTEFGVDSEITREQMVTILYRYNKATAVDSTASFKDADDISSYALDAVNWAVANGVMQGNADNTFAPKDNATRAETAAVFTRIK